MCEMRETKGYAAPRCVKPVRRVSALAGTAGSGACNVDIALLERIARTLVMLIVALIA